MSTNSAPRPQQHQLPGMPPARRQPGRAGPSWFRHRQASDRRQLPGLSRDDLSAVPPEPHAAPSWAAVYGSEGLSAEQVAFSEQFHPGSCKRPANPLTALEGTPAVQSGCATCHSVGKPNADGTIGTCTACHTRHTASVEVARLPTTCGQCHMGPDHSQIEIYEESKHGVLFQAQRSQLNLKAPPDHLTTRDMFVPTCATCHMSGSTA